MKNLLFIVLLILIETSCSILKPYTYEVCVRHSAQKSKLEQNELIGIADSTTAKMFGQTIEKGTKETVQAAFLMVTNRISGFTMKQMADSLGNFNFTVLPGQYNIVAKCVGFTDLDTLINFESGEIRELKIVLGESEGFTTYQIKSPKILSEEELNGLYKDFQDEKNNPTKPIAH